MDLDGQWLANTISKIVITENGKAIDLATATVTQHYYPGLLQQSFIIDNLEIEQQLIFVSGREALQRTLIFNHAKNERVLTISFAGNILQGAIVKPAINAITVQQANVENHFNLSFYQPVNITANEKSYSANYGEIKIAPEKSIDFIQSQCYYLQNTERPSKVIQWNFSSELKKNEQRWNGYLQKYFLNAPSLVQCEKRLAVKAMVTLMTNWRSAGKDILHEGVFPSISYQGFYGVWSWDSWKQAVGLSLFNSSLAENNIRCMFDYMDEYGMVPDCIYTDKKENNWRDTKPPLAAWAVWKVYEQSKDIAFVKELYPKLVKYHQWWFRHYGLCFAGCYRRKVW